MMMILLQCVVTNDVLLIAWTGSLQASA